MNRTFLIDESEWELAGDTFGHLAGNDANFVLLYDLDLYLRYAPDLSERQKDILWQVCHLIFDNLNKIQDLGEDSGNK